MSAELREKCSPQNSLSYVLPTSGWPREKEARDLGGRIKHRPLFFEGQGRNSTDHVATVCSPCGYGGHLACLLQLLLRVLLNSSKSWARCVFNSAMKGPSFSKPSAPSRVEP